MAKELDRTLEIERTIIKNYRPKLWAPFIKALKEFELIEENDHICVCISGGKDSMLLAKLFQELKKHSDFSFDVTYMVMNPGYNKENLDMILKNLDILKIDAVIKETNIFEIANNTIKNPCYLCARMRRGALYRLAKDMGCNKIALGHHFDDVIETTIMGLLNNGEYQTMLPKLHSDNYKGMELIRPMYFIREKDIINWANKNNLEFIRCACRFTEEFKNSDDHIGQSKRQETKMLIKELELKNPSVPKNIYKGLINVNINKLLGYKSNGEIHSFLEHYSDILDD